MAFEKRGMGQVSKRQIPGVYVNKWSWEVIKDRSPGGGGKWRRIDVTVDFVCINERGMKKLEEFIELHQGLPLLTDGEKVPYPKKKKAAKKKTKKKRGRRW